MQKVAPFFSVKLLQQRMECRHCGARMDLVVAPGEFRILHVIWTIGAIPVWYCPHCQNLFVDFNQTTFVPIPEKPEDEEEPQPERI